MARVPGLYPDRQGGQNNIRRIGGRAQAPEASNLRAPGLAPVATPVDTYARPSRPPQDNSLFQLAETLGAINPALQKFAQNMSKVDERDSRIAMMRAGQNTTPEQLRQQIKDGNVDPAFSTPVGEEYLGERLAADASRDIQAAMSNGEFDLVNGDPQELYQQKTAEIMDQLKDKPVALEKFLAKMQGTHAGLLNGSLKAKAEETLLVNRNNVNEAYRGRIESARREGTDINEAVGSMFNDIEKNRLLGIHPKEQRADLLQFAAQLAAGGDREAAKAILTHATKSGPYQGSLMDDAELGTRASNLYAQIEEDEIKAGKLVAAEESEAQLAAEVDAMWDKGQIATVEEGTVLDKEGNSKPVSKETLLKDSAMRRMKANTEEAARLAPKDEVRRKVINEELDRKYFVNNGVRHPGWFDAMDKVPGMLTQSATTGSMNPVLIDAYERYRTLNVEAPTYLYQHASKEAKDIFAMADLAQQKGLADNPEDALKWAYDATMNKEVNPDAVKASAKAVREKVADLRSGSYSSLPTWLGGNGKIEATNDSYVYDQLSREAELLARAKGVSPDDALETAMKEFPKNHINVLGTWIKNDKRYPANIEALIVRQVEEYAKRHTGYPGFDPDGLTIFTPNNGSGGFEIRDKNRNLITIPGPDKFFSLDYLLKRQAEEMKAQQAVDAQKRDEKIKKLVPK